MDEKEKDFILSDSSQTNTKGFKMDVTGGRFERFDANPVMLYDHDTKQVIGRWENRRIEGGKLLATPVFDLKDETGADIARRVKDGFLRGVSVGILPLTMEEINGEYTLKDWELIEASITPIPSDAGAVRLYNEKREIISFEQLRLNMEDKNKNTTSKTDYRAMYKQVCFALGLNPIEEIDIVLGCVNNLMKPKFQLSLDKALQMGAIRTDEKDFFVRLSRKDQSETIEMLDARIKEFEEKERKDLGKLYRDNMDKIILHFGIDGWNEVKKLGYKSIEKIVGQIPEKLILRQIAEGVRLNGSKGGEIRDLDWYRKNDPQALQADPDLFDRLQNEKRLNN